MDHVKKNPQVDVTDDVFLGGRLALLQPRQGYRAGLDAVLLASAVPLDDGAMARVIDAGAGVGTVGLCVARRFPNVTVALIEREPELVALAAANIERNGLAQRVRALAGDLSLGGGLAHGQHGLSEIAPGSIDHALANPPYRLVGSGTPGDGTKAGSHQLAAGDLERWIAYIATVTRTGGSLTLIHETSALGDILAALDGRYGAIDVKPVHPRPSEPAIRVLVQCRKGSRRPLRLLPALVLHNDGPGFTPEVEAILRTGAALQL